MEIAALEIARMSEEIDGLRAELLASCQERLESDAHLESMAERMLEIEQEIREECYMEMEKRMESEMRRWRNIWEEERERDAEHMDKKLEIYTRSMDAVPDEDKENAQPDLDLEAENDRLRREVESLRRDVAGSSPTRRPLRESRVGRGRDLSPGMEVGLERLSLGQGKERSPVKKVTRKLVTRKWEVEEFES